MIEDMARQINELKKRIEALEILEGHAFSALDIGTATGATTGQVKSSAGIFPDIGNSGAIYELGQTYTIGANTAVAVSDDLGVSGLYILRQVNDGAYALYWARSSGGAVEISDPSAVWQNSAPADSSSTAGFYLSGGKYYIKNAWAAQKVYRVFHIEL